MYTKGDKKRIVTVKEYRRAECEICGEPADYRLTFLLEGSRSNPASSAYGRDDCSRCSDQDVFVCKEHEKETRWNPPAGMSWCGKYDGISHPQHVMAWIEIDDPVYAAAPDMLEALKAISCIHGNTSLEVHGINDGRDRAINLEACIELANNALKKAEGE